MSKKNMKTFLGNGVTTVSLSHPWLLPCIIKIHWSTTERKYIDMWRENDIKDK